LEESADPDLALGLRYLHGNGVERDSEAAAHFLWKAVGKHDGSALVVLAGLYAQGDGVARNCDQAKLLIQAASRQVTSGHKIKHLETAFATLHNSGCE
jgi:TPR repeat protein